MATKAWEIDFGDVEKALQKKGVGPPAPPVQDMNSPDPGRAHLVAQQQAAAQQALQDMNSPDPNRAALTERTNAAYDQVAAQLGLGDTEVLSSPTPPLPTSDYVAPTQWDGAAADLSGGMGDRETLSSPTPYQPVVTELTTPASMTGAAPLSSGAQQPTITSPIVTGQEQFDSAGQSAPGGIIDTVGQALASPLAVIASTPGYRALQDRNEDAIKQATADGSALTPMESIKQAGWSALGMFGLGADAVKTTKIPGTDLTIGQAAKTVLEESGNESAMSLIPNLDIPKIEYNPNAINELIGGISQGFQQWTGINRQIEALPDAIKPDASMALLNTYSGYETVQSTLDSIINKDATVASIIDRARQAQNVGDDIGAANLGAQALKLQNTSAVELVDQKTSLLPELGYTMVLDPLNAVGGIFKAVGLTPEAIRAGQAAKLFDVTPTEALERLPGAVADAVGAADIVKSGDNLLSWWDKVNPFASTPETLAAKDGNILYRMAASLFGDVSTKADAQAIVTALVERPEDLVKGLYNLTSEGLIARSDKAGKVAFDAGVVANDEVLDAMKVLQLGADRLKQMVSLAGEGGLNKLEFLSEFDDIMADAARRTYGLDKLIQMPVGTKSVKVITEGKNTFVQFLDAAGREAGRSAGMTADVAKARLKDLNNAIATAGKGNFNLLSGAAQAQRAIMSEIWLNMRPGHWVGNAISAYTHLFADGLYTFKKTDEIAEDLMKLAGGLNPNQRIAEALAGGETAQSLFRKIPIVGRPLAAWSEAGAAIKSGNSALFGLLAFGEQNFYMRAYHTAFRRVFNSQWERTVTRQMGDVFAKLGVDPAIAKNLTDLALEAASTGGKQEMIAQFRKALNNVQTSFALKQFGIAAEDISPEGQRLLRQMFEAGPASVSDAIAQVNKIFRDESRRYQEILRQSAPEAGRYAFTTLENMQDGADIVDDLGRAAKKAGIDPAGIPQQLTKQVTDTEQAIYNSLFYDLGGSTEPAQLHIAIDMWGQLHEAKQAVRQRLGQLADDTIKVGTDQAWAQYFATARQEWDNYSKLAQQIGDQARLDLQGGQAARRYDAWEMIEAYSMSDEADLLALRQQGFDVGKTADQQERFKRILAAQRRFVDNYVAQTYSIFNRYPSLDSLDIVVSAQRDVDRLGAQAAAHVGEARDKLFANEITLQEFYNVRNRTWYELADAQASRWRVATREVIFTGEKEKFPTKLKWTESAFNLGEFELLRPVQQGDRTFWYARSVEDGSVHKFLDPMDKGGALPQVPQSVINDYNRMTGELDKLVDTVAEVTEAAPPRSNPALGNATATEVTDFERQNPLFAAVNAQQIEGGLPPLHTTIPAYEGNIADLSRDEIATLREAKTAMQAEWDRVAAQFEDMPSLQSMTAMLQTRTGGGTPDVKIGGVRWDDSPIVREFAEMMFGPDGTGEDVIKWLRDYSKLNADIDAAGAVIREGKRFVGMDAEQVLNEARNILPEDVIDDLRKGGANRQEIIDTINAYVNDEGLKTYDLSVPLVDVEGQARAAAEKEAADFLASYTLDAKKQLAKWFNIEGDGIKDLYKAISETNNGRAALGGTWQPGMGDYADYMNRRTERARRLIIQNIEAIMKGGPNTLSPQQRLRAFDAMVSVAREYDGVLGTAAKAAEDTANFAMLNYADRRNLDNIIGMWTPYHFFFTRTAKNWMERSILKPSLLAAYYKTKKAADQYADQNNLPDRLRGKVYVGNWGGEDRYIPNPIEIMLPYNVYGAKGFDDPEEAGNGWERAYNYAQMLGFGALPVYDAAIKWASGKGDTIQVGDYIPQYRALNYLYQSVTGQSLPSAGDEFDPYRTGRAAGIMAIQGKTSPTLAQWAQDIAYQVMTGMDALPEQPKQAQAVYEAAAKAAGWDVSLARLGSFFLGMGIYTYTDAEKAAREAQAKYAEVGYQEGGNEFGSKAAKDAIMDSAPWLSAWWGKSALAPQGSQSNPDRNTVRPGAQASFGEMMQEKDKLNEQQNAQIDQYIMAELGKGTDPIEIQKQVWVIIKRYNAQRDGIEAAHPSAAISSSDTPYNGWNPQELGAMAYELAVKQAKEQLGDLPDYPAEGTPEQKRAWVEAKQQYDQRLLSLVNGYMQDPSALVAGRKVDTSGLPTDPKDVIKLYDQRYMTPIQKGLADKVAELKAAKTQEIQKWSKSWDEYNGLGNDYDAKRKYLEANPEFAAYLAARNKSRGIDSWWLRERQRRSFSGGGGGRGRSGGSGRSYGGNQPTDYSNLFPSIAAWAQRTPKAPGVSGSINPILWQMTGRKYGSK